MTHRRGLVTLLLGLAVAAWLLAAGCSGADKGFLHLLPALLLCLPLLLGRYPGERRLAMLANRAYTARRPRPGAIAAARVHLPLMRRGRRLVASSLAKRPPPALAQPLIA